MLAALLKTPPLKLIAIVAPVIRPFLVVKSMQPPKLQKSGPPCPTRELGKSNIYWLPITTAESSCRSWVAKDPEISS